MQNVLSTKFNQSTSKIYTKMKSILSVLLFLAIASAANAQTDDIWGVNTNGQLIKFQVSTGTWVLASAGEVGTNAILPEGSAACGIFNDYVYYVPFGSQSESAGEGKFSIRSVKTDGTGDKESVAEFDLNGSSNNQDLSFVRLGFDKQGTGWIVAKGEGNVFYVGKFTPNADGTASNLENVGTFTISGGSNILGGDLAFDDRGSMYLLVNGGSDILDTRIYVIGADILDNHTSPSSNTNISAPKWILKKPGGGNFSRIINGIAFASDGSLYISSDDALYYVDATTVDGTGGTVQVKEIAKTGDNSVADLATQIFTSTTLPVKFGAINAQTINNQLQVNWQTLQEDGVKGYTIEASTDGKNWKTIGNVDSKAPNGNSKETINYQFSMDLSAMAVAGLSLAFLILPLFKSRVAKIAMMVVIIGGLVSCAKNSADVDVAKAENVWVRIVQHDIDGGSSASDVFKAVNR